MASANESGKTSQEASGVLGDKEEFGKHGSGKEDGKADAAASEELKHMGEKSAGSPQGRTKGGSAA